jgi:hypothetical protein
MAKLKNKNAEIPGGIRFRQAQIPQWKSPPGGFKVVVSSVIAMRRANPGITKQYNLSLDPVVVADEVDAYCAALCKAAGYNDFITEGGGGGPDFPKTFPSQWNLRSGGPAAGANSQPSTPPSWFRSLGQVGTGIRTLADWLGHDGVPVAKELSEKRASICASGGPDGKRCQFNMEGDLTSFFTKPASELIRRQLAERNEMKLETSHDANLGVCDGCGCPLKLKVHCPLEFIKKHIPAGGEANLSSFCWITKE